MLKLTKATMLAGMLSLSAAATASATTGPAMLMADGTPGRASNTAAVSGNTTNFPGHTMAIGGLTFTCADANYTVTTVATTSATLDPDYTGCQIFVSGTPVAGATIDTPCDWDLSFADGIFNNTTGSASSGTLTTTCVTTVTVPAINCTLHLAAQNRGGLFLQNINEAGGNDTSATPWGSKLTMSITGITYTATGSCPGAAEHGTMTYAGTVAVRAVTGSL